MGRIRTIKPEFPQSETIGKLSREARLLFIQLWTICDDSGRSRASSRLLASLLYPYDSDAAKLMPSWIRQLCDQKCICLYRHEGDSYLQICNWLKHQKIDRPSASRYPAFDESSRVLSDPSTTDKEEEVDKEEDFKSTSKASPSEWARKIYQAYPRHEAPKRAYKAIEKVLQRNDPAVILEVVHDYAKFVEKTKKEIRYVPHPATWFNDGSYLQEEWI